MIRFALVAALLPAAPVMAQQPAPHMVVAAPLTAQQPAPRVVVAAGIEWSKFPNAERLEEEGQTTTAFVLDDVGFDFTVAGEVFVLDWLAAGVGYERLSRIDLDQSFDVAGFRDFTSELTSAFDPSVFELYAAPSWPVGSSVRISGMLGVGFWRAERDSTVALLFEGEELSRETLLDEHDGTSVVVGAGVDLWPHRRFGVRAGYKYVKLSAADVDEPVHNLRVLALFGF